MHAKYPDTQTSKPTDANLYKLRESVGQVNPRIAIKVSEID
jgi:hypothetical protein